MTQKQESGTEKEETLQQALSRCESGDFEGAESLMRPLCAAHSDDEWAQRLLAQTLYGQKRFEEAANLMDEVIRLNPTQAAHYNDQGAMLAALKRWPEAEAAYRMAKALNPSDPNAAFNLALSLFRQKKTDAAQRELDTLQQKYPDLADAYALRGEILLDDEESEEKLEEAVVRFTQALEKGLESPEVHVNLAFALFKAGKREEAFKHFYAANKLDAENAYVNYHMGFLLREEGDLDKARSFVEKAIEINADFVPAHDLLGQILLVQGEALNAEAVFLRALALAPDNPGIHLNLGNCYNKQRKIDAAIAAFRRSIELAPGDGAAWNNLALLYASEQQFDKAEAAFEKALSNTPEAPLLRFNHSLYQLVQGNFETGWKEYEQRFKTKKNKTKPSPEPATPRWNGESLEGKSLLIEREQGLGDILQFIRYLAVLRARYPSARLAFQCYSPLFRLFSLLATKLNVKLLPGPSDDTVWDFSIPLLSLPMHIAGEKMTIPSDTPYLDLPERFVKAWGEHLAPLSGKRVGLVWSGGEQYGGADQRNMRLKQFLPLFDIPGIAWVSLQKLQKGQVSEEIAEAGLSGTLFDAMTEVKDFADTAAILANLDLVISVDTSVAHLAGAMGVPVWLMNRFDTDWRWLYEASDSLWYPTMRIFRQRSFGDWGPVVEEAARALADWLATPQMRQMWTLVNPPRPDAAFSLALALFRGGKTEDALRVLEVLEEHHPDFAWQFALRGKMLRAERRDAEAVDALSRAIALGIDAPDVVAHFGMALADAGFSEEAFHVLAETGKVDASHPDVNYCLGTLLCKKGELHAARDHFEKAVAAHPRFLEAFDALANVLQTLGDTEGSARARARAHTLSEDDKHLRTAISEFSEAVFNAPPNAPKTPDRPEGVSEETSLNHAS